MDNQKQIISYCFMAALNNNNHDLFSDVYIPLTKRALSSYSLSNEYGSAEDLRNEILNLYNLTIPIYTVRQLLKALGKITTIPIKLFEKGEKFNIEKFTFLELEALYQNEAKDAKRLEEEFISFIRRNHTNLQENIELLQPFISFINLNKSNISNYFNIIELNPTFHTKIKEQYRHHAEFLIHCHKKDKQMFTIIEKVFLGSVIAAFLESSFELESKFEENITYFFDTQFILSLLDLQSEEETIPTNELINLIKESDGKGKVFELTIDEIENILQKSIDNFNSNPLVNTIKNNTISYACNRRKLTKTDLQIIKRDLRSTLLTQFNINIDPIPQSIIEKTKKSTEYKELDKDRLTDSGLHDVAVIFQIANLRNGNATTFKKSKFWFVTLNKTLIHFNKQMRGRNSIPECIYPESLTSLLWLKKPDKINQTIDVGLNILLANTLMQDDVPASILVDLDKLIRSKSKINSNDYALLISNLSKESVDTIEEFLEFGIASTSDNFNVAVLKRIEKEKYLSEAKNIETQTTNKTIEKISKQNEDNRQLIRILIYLILFLIIIVILLALGVDKFYYYVATTGTFIAILKDLITIIKKFIK